jgi:hypothetical protein
MIALTIINCQMGERKNRHTSIQRNRSCLGASEKRMLQRTRSENLLDIRQRLEGRIWKTHSAASHNFVGPG